MTSIVSATWPTSKGNVDFETTANVDTDALAQGFLKSRGLDGDRVGGGFEVVELVVSSGVGFAAPGFVGGDVGDGNLGPGDGCQLWIGDTTGDGSSGFLRLDGGRSQQ